MENMTEKEYKEKLFTGDFRDFGTVEIVEFQFIEKNDLPAAWSTQSARTLSKNAKDRIK